MIAIFRWVHNSLWYDLREFDLIDWIPKNYKWLKIEKHVNIMHEYPVFIARIACEDEFFFKQFESYSEEQQRLF